MSERDQQRPGSPLESERGRTTVKDGVVSKLASMAAGEVEGIRMGGGASRAARGVLESVTGSQSLSLGVSVEVGRVETAIDVSVEVEYGRNILQLAERVRDRITERVENLTGLRVTELNVTVNDIIFPEEEGRSREEERRGGLGDEARTREQRTEEIGASSREREATDTKQPVDVEARERTGTEGERGLGDREEARVEGAPLDEDETAELRLGDETGRGRRQEE